MTRSTMDQLRITYIHQHFKPPTESGGGRPYEFARRLAQEGARVTMIAAGEQRRTYELSGFTVEEIPTTYDNMMSFPRRIFSFVDFMARACWVAVRLPAQVVLASSTPLTVVVPGIIAARRYRARFIVEIRDLWPQVPLELGFLPRWLAPPARALERLAYSEADEVIALSPSMAEGVRAVSPSSPVHVIPNAADTDLVRPTDPHAVRAELGINECDTLFAYAGSLGVIYEPSWLARLAIALEEAGARLVVAGEGKAVEAARQELRDAGISPERVFVGSKSRRQALELIAVCDVAVSSLIAHESLEGSSLNKVGDALAFGRPMLFNHGGWLSDLVTQAGAGWHCPREMRAEDIPSLLAEIRLGHDEASIASAALAQEAFDREKLFREFRTVLWPPRTS